MPMRPIILADIASTAPGAPLPDVRIEQGAARRVIAGPKAPIDLADYRLAPGGQIAWTASAQCRTVWVRGGAIAVGGRHLPAESTLVIEGGAAAAAVAGPDGAELIEFRANRGPSRQGGQVHAVAAPDVPRSEHNGVRSAVHSDSCCAGCGVWLHENHLAEEGREVVLHSHTEDEVILVIDGEMIAGRQRHGPGSALSVARGTLYGFSTGRGGLRFINFRPSRPGYLRHGDSEVIDELSLYAGWGLPPAVHTPV